MRVRLSPKAVVAAVFVSAMFINIMDQTVVNVALPTMSRGFGVQLAAVSGVVTAYLVTLAVVMPASGWIGDKLGPKLVMLGSIGLFTGASAMCGLSASLPELVAFRAVQGIGGGMLVPVGMAMLFRAFPPAERIRANRVLMVPTLLAPASGPVIGGLLVDGLSWRWIFFINVPIGLAAVREPPVPGHDAAAHVRGRRVLRHAVPGAAPPPERSRFQCPALRPVHVHRGGRRHDRHPDHDPPV